MANKADIIPEVEVEPAPKTGGKRSTATRQRRLLFDPEDAQEPFLCTPEKVGGVHTCLMAAAQVKLLIRVEVLAYFSTHPIAFLLFLFIYLPYVHMLQAMSFKNWPLSLKL